MPYFEHYHPSVVNLASNLLSPHGHLPKPDLASHTLIHFLDKFVYRNPKTGDGAKGSSIMQPVLAEGSAAHIVTAGKVGAHHKPTVNSAEFWNKKVQDIAAEDIFFHTYFSQIGKSAQATKSKKRKKTDEDEAGSDDEDEIWQALVESNPEIEGADDEADLDGSDDDDVAALLDQMSDSDDEAEAMEDLPDDDDDEGEDLSDGGVELVGFSDEEDPASEVDEQAEDEEVPTKSKKAATKEKKERKKKFKEMPVFATADDYAHMLGDDDDQESG
jgi:ribosome biogenesis protein MAK21